ncbi:MAG: NAD-dependent epimerase/dehydratase family protein [Candidatus Omnitrophica bacterium]|nr:NAD-dependent epimerase/dehydratase family protein [Candidatus Omnitrophota bacterium]
MSKKTYLVTGGAGFIGSHLVDRLARLGRVIVYDNLSSGRKEFIAAHLGKKDFKFVKADLLNRKVLQGAMRGVDTVFHMAANPEIRVGETNPHVDFSQGIMATYNVLEAMRGAGVNKIVFASSSTVFGEPAVRPTSEEYGPMIPISVYGASKLSCEGLISAYCHMYGMQAWVFRFANIIGRRGTHGILIDFIKKLENNKGFLKVLGNGRQRKSYLLVEDVADGILFAWRREKGEFSIFNLGTDDDILIADIARIVLKKWPEKKIRIRYTGGARGWRGDVPVMLLDPTKMKKLGWHVRYGSRQAVEKAMDDLLKERAA